MTYGYTPTEKEDLFVHLAGEGMRQFSLSTAPGKFLVNHFPLREWFFLPSRTETLLGIIVKYVPSWLPGGGFKKTAKVWRKTTDDMASKPFDWVKREMVPSVTTSQDPPHSRSQDQGTATLSFVSELLSEPGCTPERESDIKWSATSLYAGAADTVSLY